MASKPKLISAEACHYHFVWQSKYACIQCQKGQSEQIRGQCEEWRTKNGISNFRRIVSQPKEGLECMIPPNTDDLIHSYISPDRLYKKLPLFVDKEIEFEECSPYDDLNSPMVKFFSMLAAIFVAIFGIIGSLICCSYC